MESSTLMSLLPLVLLVAIVIGVMKWQKRQAKSGNAGLTSPSGQTPYGVGGWLSFYLVASVVLSPLKGIGTQSAEFAKVELQSPTIVGVPEWESYKYASWGLLALLVLWQWWVAYDLTKKFVPKSVYRAKVMLGASPFLAVGLDAISAKSILGVTPGWESVPTLMVTLMSHSIWFFYFTLSVRVKNTYFPTNVVLGKETT